MNRITLGVRDRATAVHRRAGDVERVERLAGGELRGEELEKALDGERSKALQLARQADNLKDLIGSFVYFREEVITRRTRFPQTSAVCREMLPKHSNGTRPQICLWLTERPFWLRLWPQILYSTCNSETAKS